MTEQQEGQRWTVSICRLHDAPLFQPLHGCTCNPKNTFLAKAIEVIPADPNLVRLTEAEKAALKRAEWGTEGLCPVCWPLTEAEADEEPYGYEGKHGPDCALESALAQLQEGEGS